jgi:hypothetical protein
MIDKEVRAKLVSDIKAHLLIHGSTNWKGLQERYATVSKRTFWRVRDEVVKELAADTLEPDDGSRSWGDSVTFDLGEASLPASWDPFDPASFRAQIELLARDCDALRRCSLGPKGEIRDAALYEKAIKLAAGAVRLQSKQEKLSERCQFTRDYTMHVFDIVASESPETGERLAAELNLDWTLAWLNGAWAMLRGSAPEQNPL